MSYGVSITQEGTVLSTAGKYVEQDIVVGMSDSIKKAAATYTPTTTDQTIAAGQYLSGAQTIKGDANLVAGNIKSGVSIFGVSGNLTPGITPTGTKNITANGTYDVTEYASANVAVPIGAANIKRFEVTIAAQFTGTTLTLISGDADVAAHFADSTAFCFLMKKETTNTVYRDMLVLFNSNINASTTGAYFRKGSSGNVDASNGTAQKLSGTQASTDNCIFANSSGNIVAKCVATYSTLASGDYYIIFGW